MPHVYSQPEIAASEVAVSKIAESEVAVLIPVKSFTTAKHRLAPTLGTTEREDLARHMATHVVACAGSLPVAVVCDTPNVRSWAISIDTQVIWCPNTGLNNAVRCGVNQLRDAGYKRIIVAHGDLPLAGLLEPLGDWPGITLAPDHRNDGTNVIALPSDSDFQFQYGAGSFQRHLAEAQRTGCSLRVLRNPSFGLDIDIPEDLQILAGLNKLPNGLQNKLNNKLNNKLLTNA
ncbi:MAG: 2-phospho-L-lactate guanylyltransferase [Acidimicrobiia bacterium]|nr:2-phospho-L-lactate guanylyltransferase [Acidimicrobiia bacterium]MYC57813.1 2-phospho-L-lactate guanylyltransferase [Acidimicrobiia bacterium]MYI29828.1 2-phospho-L-lactate guanylyltransferase [Acidimicrobiia bacterium]